MRSESTLSTTPDRRAQHHGTGVVSGDPFHPGSHVGGLGPEERHRLPLHIGTHQGTVGVVVLQEWDQRSSHTDQLLGRNVDEIDLFPIFQHKVAGLPGIHQER